MPSAYVRRVAAACCALALGACGAEPAGTATPADGTQPPIGTAPTATPVASATSAPASMFDSPGGGLPAAPGVAPERPAPESMAEASRPLAGAPPASMSPTESPRSGAHAHASAPAVPALEETALPPPPVEATRAAVPADREHAWRVQLGAYARGSTAASIAWEGLVQRHAALAGRTPLIGAAVGPEGRAIHRLQVAGLTRGEAADLCAALAATGDACVVVPPPHARPR